MGFIFGVIRLDQGQVKEPELRRLSEAVAFEDFEHKIELTAHYGVGYCWKQNREPEASIYIDDWVTVVGNGQLYNQGQIGDYGAEVALSETFASAYKRDGERFVEHIDGDFSAVIIDHRLRKVLLYRDHIGTHSLCYTLKDGMLIFASHEFGMVKSRLIKTDLSEKRFISRLSLHHAQDYQQTVFNEILRVVPGHLLSISEKKIESLKYWYPEKIKQNRSLTLEDSIATLRRLMVQAVAKRVNPKKVMGAHLSGGLDSSGVTAILADLVTDKERLTTYSWTPDEKEEVEGTDERHLIDDFVSEKEIRVRYRPNRQEAFKNLISSPEFENMEVEEAVMKMAQEDGTELIFSGWGGDEFVSLSTRGVFNHLVLHFKCRSLYQWLKRFGVRQMLARTQGEIMPLVLPSFLLKGRINKKKRLLGLFYKSFVLKHFISLAFSDRKCPYGWGGRRRFMMNLLHNYHLPRRMDSWFMFGEKYGIEYKYPLLDKELLEFWFSIPVEYTYHHFISRYLYREAMKGILPEYIRLRPDKHEECLDRFVKRRRIQFVEDWMQTKGSTSDPKQLSFIDWECFEKAVERLKTAKDIEQFLCVKEILRHQELCRHYL